MCVYAYRIPFVPAHRIGPAAATSLRARLELPSEPGESRGASRHQRPAAKPTPQCHARIPPATERGLGSPSPAPRLRSVKRSTGHIHTHRQRTSPPTTTHTHAHDENNTPNEHLPQAVNNARRLRGVQRTKGHCASDRLRV